jgi:PTH1 family peptidyl-tRNA hydrolase
VGLGNPGPQYSKTRHNAGFWFLDALAERERLVLRQESRFQGLAGKLEHQGQPLLLLEPQGYMNRSGHAVAMMARYWKIPPEEILVAHDELDFPPGTIKAKQGGGHGGHNGLRDIVAQLGSNNFFRLRIGIGHPGDRSKVTDYVLGPPGKAELEAIAAAIDSSLAREVLDHLLAGEISQAMTRLARLQTPARPSVSPPKS